MSLNNEQLLAAMRRSEEMEKRLVKLFGFSPAASNHYGKINIYNVNIDSKTTDEELVAIREKYAKWKTGILNILEEYGFKPGLGQLSTMFRSDPMFGTLSFLSIPVDIESSPENYRPAIMEYLRENKISEKTEK